MAKESQHRRDSTGETTKVCVEAACSSRGNSMRPQTRLFQQRWIQPWDIPTLRSPMDMDTSSALHRKTQDKARNTHAPPHQRLSRKAWRSGPYRCCSPGYCSTPKLSRPEAAAPCETTRQ